MVKIVVDEAINAFGGIDVLVNNAGYLHGSFIEEAELVSSFSYHNATDIP